MKMFRVLLFCIISTQVHAGDMGFSMIYRPPLFGCVKGGCNGYKFSWSPVSEIKNASTDNDKVASGAVLTEQHCIGYWAPKGTVYVIAPLSADSNIYGNTYTALDIDVIAYYYHLSDVGPGLPITIIGGGQKSSIYTPLINWTHAQDPNVGLNGSEDKGFAYYLYQHYFNTEHHDRTYSLFSPKTLNLTTISYANLKVPVGTIAEYFSGVSTYNNQVLAYWPLHMIDPLEEPYPDINDKNGFNYPEIRKKITNYAEVYKNIGF